VGVTVLVDIVFLLPFSAFSCTGSVSVRNISLYSKLNRLSNHLRLAATSCAAQASKQNKPQKAQFRLFPRGGRVCALHHSYCPAITNVTCFRFPPARQRYLFFISISPCLRPSAGPASALHPFHNSHYKKRKQHGQDPQLRCSSDLFFLLPAEKIRPHHEPDDQSNDQRSGRLPHINK
jgi:hypothetical protein